MVSCLQEYQFYTPAEHACGVGDPIRVKSTSHWRGLGRRHLIAQGLRPAIGTQKSTITRSFASYQMVPQRNILLDHQVIGDQVHDAEDDNILCSGSLPVDDNGNAPSHS